MSGSPLITTKLKLSWDKMCKPKREGQRWFRSLYLAWFTKSFLSKFNLVSDLELKIIMVAWTRIYLLRNQSFCDFSEDWRGSWMWKKLLKMRVLGKTYIWTEINGRTSTHFGFDNWVNGNFLFDIAGEWVYWQLEVHCNTLVSQAVNAQCWKLRLFRAPIFHNMMCHIRAFPRLNLW